MSLNTTRSVGTKFFSANYEVRKAGPLDARLITPLHSELYDLNSIDFRYPGMIISVFGDTEELNGLWFNKNPATDSTTGLSVDDWIKLGSSDTDTEGGGNPVTKVEFKPETSILRVTLTHDGNGVVPIWESNDTDLDGITVTKQTNEIIIEGTDLVSELNERYILVDGGLDDYDDPMEDEYVIINATLSNDGHTILSFEGDAIFDPTTETTLSTYENSGAFPLFFETFIETGGVYSPTVGDNPWNQMDEETNVVPVGGHNDGSVTAGQLQGKSFTEMWNTLLFPAVPPTEGAVAARLTLNNPNDSGKIYYIGDIVDPAELISTIPLNLYKPNWSSGEEYTPGVGLVEYEKINVETGQFDLISSITVEGGSNVPNYDDGPHTIKATTVSDGDSTSNPNLWKATVHFQEGTEVGSDNLGNDFGSPYPGGTKTNFVHLFGTLPIYMNDESDNWVEIAGQAGPFVNSAPFKQKMSRSTIEWYASFIEKKAGTNNPYHRLAVPKDILTLHGDDVNPATSFEFFDTNLDDYAEFSVANWRKEGEENFTVNGVSYTYDVYIHDASGQAGGDLRYILRM